MVNQPIDHAISKAKYSEKDQIWGIAWSWKGPQSVRIFRWLVLHNRLKMKAELTRRHIQIVVAILLEDVLHVLRDCMVAKRVWNCIILVNS